MKEIIVDNFAGGGGASTGIELATGRSVDIAINHDPHAIAMHETNHPDTLHYCESVFDIDPVTATAGRPVGLAWFSPDCFPSGTLVLTKTGYKPIEDIAIGEFVLTHMQRWRKVVETSSAERLITKIRGHGHPGLICSLEHPFYVKLRSNIWNNDIRQYRPDYTDPEWVPASLIQKGHYWATPTTIPEIEIPKMKHYAKGTRLPIDERLLWLAGRYVGDGWSLLTETRAELVIICGKHEIDELEQRIDMWPRTGQRVRPGELSWSKRELRTACQLTANSRALVEWLREHFGHRALGKKLPAWLYGAPVELRKAFINGYMSADGWNGLDAKSGNMFESNTVSKGLAFGMRQLISTLGFIGTIFTNLKPTNVIEGRSVNVKTLYKLRWRESVCENHTQTFTEDGLLWTPVRENTPLNRMVRVFNIGVEEDESYVVEGVVVHNCRHFSKAKGGAPVKKEIRGLAWVKIGWILKVRPRMTAMENVEEFKTWGPLVTDARGNDYPCPQRVGETFAGFVAMLTTGIAADHPALAECCEILGIEEGSDDHRRLIAGLGYAVEFRELRACDYGAPTIRKRFFMMARCDGQPIVWPEPTHGDPKSKEVQTGKLKPWRTAAEIIDWSLPTKSIFGRKKDLADNTLRRIVKGLQRFVINNPDPYIVQIGQTGFGGDGRQYSAEQPLTTITSKAEHLLIEPYVVKSNHTSSRTKYNCFRGQSGRLPLQTITRTHGFGIAAPVVVRQFGNSTGQPVDAPVGTVMPGGGGKTQLGSAVLVGAGGPKYSGKPRPIDTPMITLPTTSHTALASAHLLRFRQGSHGQSLDKPLNTLTTGAATGRPATGVQHALVAANLVKHYGGNYTGAGLGVDEPLHTVTQVDHHGLCTSHLVHLRGTCKDGRPITEPVPTIMAGGQHNGHVQAFLTKYYGTATAVDVAEPVHAVTTKDRMALTEVHCDQDPLTEEQRYGAWWCARLLEKYSDEPDDNHLFPAPRPQYIRVGDYIIVDICMRMLEPRELYRAQGFPEWYIIDRDYRGKKYSKAAQVARCGNAVPPPFAEALVRANLPDMCIAREGKAA